MTAVELFIVLACYSVACIREMHDKNYAMAWIWFSYALSVIGFISMRMKGI